MPEAILQKEGLRAAPRRLDLRSAELDAIERARLADERAQRARQHARLAAEQALRDAALGDTKHEVRHRQEAELHRRAAARQEEAAALQRLHASYLRAPSEGSTARR